MHRRHWTLRLAWAVAVLTVVAFGATPPVYAGGLEWRDDLSGPQIYRIRNANSDLCLALQNHNNVNGVQAFQYMCDYEDQFWYLHMGSDGYYELQVWPTTKCLTVNDAANGSPVVGWTCGTQGDKQRWFIAVNSVESKLVNKYSNKCMVIQTANPSSAAFQYTCLAFADQYWYQDWFEYRTW